MAHYNTPRDENQARFSAAHLAGTYFFFATVALILLNWGLYPLGNGRDELDHWRLIHYYAQYNQPPRLPEDLPAASLQGHQPPLYYWLMSRLFPNTPPPDYAPNRFFLTGNYLPELPYYNRTLFLIPHPPPEAHGLRAASLFFYGLGLLVLWRALPPGPARLLALALLSLPPNFWRTALAITANSWLFLLACCFTAALLHYRGGWRGAAALGVILGLGLLTKLYFAPLAFAVLFKTLALSKQTPLPLNPLLPEYREEGGLCLPPSGSPSLYSGKGLGDGVLLLLLPLLIAGPWYVRNTLLYGDPTAISLVETLSDSRHRGELLPALLLWPGELWTESWGVLNTRPWLYGASAAGWLLTVLAIPGRARLWAIVLPVGALMLAGELRNAHAVYSPPLILVATPALSLLWAEACLRHIPPRHQWRVVASLVLILGVFTTAYQFRVFIPQFPPALPAKTDPPPYPLRFANGMRLLAYDSPRRAAQPGEQLWFELCWGGEVKIVRDYAVTLKILDGRGGTIAAQDGYPLGGRRLTSTWRPDEGFCEWVPLRIPPDAPPGRYPVFIGVYDPRSGQTFPYLRADGAWDVYLTVDTLIIHPDDP
jgi:hypothetical protein